MAKARKVVHRLYVNDEDDNAPVIKIRLDDASINRKAVEAHNVWLENREIIDAVADGTLADSGEDSGKLLDIWKGIIIAGTSADAYREIVEYLRDGEDVDDSEMLVVMAPIVVEIMDVLEGVLSAGNSKAYAKYLKDRKEPQIDVI